MKVVIVGATGALGRAMAVAEAKRGSELHLIASDFRDLEVLRIDLKIRFDVQVSVLALDLRDQASVDQISTDADRYYFPVGAISEADDLGTCADSGRQILEVNFLCEASIIAQIFTQGAASATGKARSVEIIGIGSIAETRGRSKNVFYSAAKRALTSYYESLLYQSLRPEQGISVKPYLFQIGYMNSQMSFGKKLLFPVAEPDWVAKKIIWTLENRAPGIRYLPTFWLWICLILRYLPWCVYGRLKF